MSQKIIIKIEKRRYIWKVEESLTNVQPNKQGAAILIIYDENSQDTVLQLKQKNIAND